MSAMPLTITPDQELHLHQVVTDMKKNFATCYAKTARGDDLGEDVVIGDTHSMRAHGCWRPISAATHAGLNERTRRLRPAYQANLEGKGA